MDPANAPPLPALDNTLGAYLLGSSFGLLLQGIVYLQMFQYFRLYPKDPAWLKTWVIALAVFETINSVLPLHYVYNSCITNYFNPAVLVSAPVWSLKFLPVPGSIAAVITQLFFARRVYLIDRRFRILAVVASVLTLAFAGCYIALTGLGWNSHTIDEFLKFSWLSSLGSSMIMASDLMMTAALIYFLRTNHTGVTRTDSMLDILITYTISSGLIICVFNILNVTFALVWPDNLIFAATSIILTKLYSNTFLVSLNTRQSLLNRAMVMDATMPFSSTIMKRSARTTTGSGHRRVEVPIEVDVEEYVETDRDGDHHGSGGMELKIIPHPLMSTGSLGVLDIKQSSRGDGSVSSV